VSQSGVLEAADLSKLVEIVKSPGIATSVRLEALLLLCQGADESTSGHVVNVVTAVFAPLREAHSKSDAEVYALSLLLEAFLRDGATQLARRTNEQRPLLDLAVMVFEGLHPLNWFLGALASARIADSPAPLAVRQEYMLRVLAKMPDLPAPEAFYDLFDANVAPAIRDLAFDAPLGKLTGNVAAFDLLVECGDLETAARYEQRFEALGGNVEELRRPGGYVWKIRAKHDPSLLLEHLRTAECGAASSESKLWALSRSLRHGVPRSQIHAALVEYFRRCGRVEFRSWEGASFVKKALGAEPDLLTEEDLAEIEKKLDDRGQ
jgi:hypothetical protein